MKCCRSRSRRKRGHRRRRGGLPAARRGCDPRRSARLERSLFALGLRRRLATRPCRAARACLGWREQRIDIVAHGSAGHYLIEQETERIAVTDARLSGDTLSAQIDGQARRFRCRVDGSRLFLHDGTRRLTLARLPAFHMGDAELIGGGDRVQAPMPGRIVLIRVAVGDVVEEGQELGVMEAMKMELGLKAPRAGIVAEVRVADGDFVDGDALLVLLEATP